MNLLETKVTVGQKAALEHKKMQEKKVCPCRFEVHEGWFKNEEVSTFCYLGAEFPDRCKPLKMPAIISKQPELKSKKTTIANSHIIF